MQQIGTSYGDSRGRVRKKWIAMECDYLLWTSENVPVGVKAEYINKAEFYIFKDVFNTLSENCATVKVLSVTFWVLSGFCYYYVYLYCY